MNTDLMVRHAQLAGLPGSGKAVAVSLLARPSGDERPRRVERSDAHDPVAAAYGTAACDREVAG